MGSQIKIRRHYEEHSYLKRKIYSALQIPSEAKSITTNKTRILNYLKNIMWGKKWLKQRMMGERAEYQIEE